MAAPSGDDLVALTGIVRSRTEWGPPGFGETPKADAKVVIFTLKLSAPRTGKQLSLPEEGGKQFTELQLRCDSTTFPNCESALKKSVGQKVKVSGLVESAAAPTDYLPVILRVRSIANQ